MSAKQDPPFTSDAEIAELVRLFESCALPGERWTHRTHLAVAATYLQRYPLPEATDRARAHIRQYNESRGKHTGYHETITVVFMRIVAHHLSALAGDVASFVNRLAEQYSVATLLEYYSKDRLWSDEARGSFIEPDVRPFDF